MQWGGLRGEGSRCAMDLRSSRLLCLIHSLSSHRRAHCEGLRRSDEGSATPHNGSNTSFAQLISLLEPTAVTPRRCSRSTAFVSTQQVEAGRVVAPPVAIAAAIVVRARRP